jgi:integrase
LIAIFAATTGLRPAEWIALEKRDLDRDGRVVYVRRSFAKGVLKRPKTDASLRAVPLQARALDALQHIGKQSDSPLLFPGERGGYLDIHHFRPYQWQPAQSPPASTRVGGSTISGIPLRPSRFVPAFQPSTSPATWAPA